MEQNKATVLSLQDVSVSYGEIIAIKNVSLEVSTGEIVTLIGSNGAGKSTLLNTVLGIQRPYRGTIRFLGSEVTRKPTESIVAAGIAVVPEGRGVLPMMTVMENLLLGAYRVKYDITDSLNRVFERFPVLAERKNQVAGTLSGGQQQMLAIGRALVSSPRLLLLDEPSLGLAPVMVDTVFKILTELRDSGLTILLSEQNARKALQYADRGYVLDMGSIRLEGACRELRDHPGVRSAYLGVS